MSKVTFTEQYTAKEIMTVFKERYIDFEETEMVMDMMQNPELEMNWDNDGGIYISITDEVA